MKAILPSILFLLAPLSQAFAGLHPAAVSAGNVPWPGGVVPYVFDASLSAGQKQIYLDGLREWELAANVHFIPRTTETPYILFKYSPSGQNLYSLGNPQTVEINLLTRGQICHEMGHAFGLEHEHQRPNRDTFVTVLYGNVAPGNNSAFDILPDSVPFGAYDFESVMHYGRDVLTVSPGLDTIQTKPGYEKFQRRLSNAALSPTDRAHLASLYGAPVVPLSSVVTSTADGGVGSLRAAIYYAQDHPGSTISFNIPISDPGYAGGVFTISPTGSLPPLATNGLSIDATTQPGYAGKPLVFVNGSKLVTEPGAPGFLFYESNCTVKGLGLQQFPWCGAVIRYPDAVGNRILGCSLGVDGGGNSAAPNAYQGIMISDGAHGNFIGGTGSNERNFVSGNTQYGIWISGAATADNVVSGNYIGTNVLGTAALANQAGGVILTDGANHNTIGGDTPEARNVISGNTSAGIWVTGIGVSSNVVKGNYIGINAAGTAALGNTNAGVYVVAGATENTVLGNVLSGNGSEGLRIADSGTTNNKVYRNLAGTDAAGGAAIPNGFAGIDVLFGASGNQIGGGPIDQRNVLSGNATVGLAISSVGTQGNLVYGNYIGLDASGGNALPNGFAGVYLTDGCSGNYVGNGPGTGNLISGNGSVGVFVGDAATTGNFIRNNRIGPNATGGVTMPRQYEGVWLLGGSRSNTVGGAQPGAANIITGNSGHGVSLFDAATTGGTIQRNSIFANGSQPVGISDGANHGQTKPVLSTAVLATSTSISGTLNSSANTDFTLDFYSSPSESDNGGRNFIGSSTVTTNGSGSASFNETLLAIVKAGQVVNATVTSQATGDTSEYSNSVTVASVDTDHDGLPDAYETSTPGLSASNPADATLDNDGDGFSNLQEFQAGTNPNDSASRLISSGSVSGGSFQISFGTVAGRFYRVERSDTLSGAWETVAIHVAGTGGTVSLSLPLSSQAGRQFYRVAPGG